MSFEDRALVCRECGAEFTFTVREQEFYQSKGFENDPTRCPGCRAQRKAGRHGVRAVTEVICAGCGISTSVPFRPTGNKPVYCRDCFQARN